MKRIISIAVIFLLIFSFAGCSQNSGDSTEKKYSYNEDVAEYAKSAAEAAQKYIDGEMTAKAAGDEISKSEQEIKKIIEKEDDSLNKVADEYLLSSVSLLQLNISSMEMGKDNGSDIYSISGEIQKRIEQINEELE